MLINHARLWWPVDEMFTAHSFLVSWFTGGFQPEAHRWCTLRQDWPTSHMRQRASEGIEETLQETTTTHDPKVCQFILLYILLILLVKIFMTPFNPLPTELFKRNACTCITNSMGGRIENIVVMWNWLCVGPSHRHRETYRSSDIGWEKMSRTSKTHVYNHVWYQQNLSSVQ